MSVESIIGDVESALVRLIRLGLGWRYPAASNLTALAAMQAAILRPGSICYVTSEDNNFEWLPTSAATPNGINVILPTTLPTGKTNGRWHKVTTSWTYGAGGTSLKTKTTGYLREVEAYSTDDGPEEAITKVFGSTPSVLVQFRGDDPKSQSNLPGTFYKDSLNFMLLIVDANLLPSPAATQGSDLTSATVDPGVYQIIGQLRRLLCGVTVDFGLSDIERIELGPSNLEFEDLDRRLFVWSLGITVLGSFDIEDEDLIEMAIEAQPALTDHLPAPEFDPDNYVAVGGGLDEGEGAGLSRTIEATIATIDSVAIAVAETPITFAADSDTYRDLAPDGTWTITAVATKDPAPGVIDGQLRVGMTRTDSNGVLNDRALCSYSIPFGDPIPIP